MNIEKLLNLRKQIIEKDFSSLNNMQKEAVFNAKGPLLILAGAGSGKTTVIVNRIASLLKYGEAYYSDYFERTPQEGDEALLQAYLDGDKTVYDDIKDLLKVNAPEPWQILAITFTNKAADELKQRISLVVPEGAEEITACTFHSACVRFLRRFGESLGYTTHFTIYDTDDSKRVAKKCLEALNINEKIFQPKTVVNAISSLKNKGVSPEVYSSQNFINPMDKTVAELYVEYQKQLKEADAMDFDDLLLNAVKLLETNEDARNYYQNRYRFVMVDEYQDTNIVQYQLTHLLADKYKNLCVVGDDDQSIYAFRGATIENILKFEDNYPNAKVIRLEQNYRSTGNILAAANEVIKNNNARKGKNLWTDKGDGEKITVKNVPDEYGEADYIVDTVLNNVAKGMKWSDHAVLYRMNSQSNTIERAFLRQSIPYKLIGTKFYERKEVKDILAYLSVVSNPNDTVRLNRIINVPKRGIGDTTMSNVASIASTLGITQFEVMKTADEYAPIKRSAEKLRAFALMIEEFQEYSEKNTLEDLFTYIVTKTGYKEHLALDQATYEDRLANILELQSNLARYTEENPEGDLTGYLEEVALYTDLDTLSDESDAVVLMTLHSAKGLEFPVVFIAGVEEGIFPSSQSTYSTAELEEERRLAYVGITRAKQKLHLLHARSRMLFGSTTYCRPSRFIDEIPDEFTEGKKEASPLERAYKQTVINHQKTDYKEKMAANRGFSVASSKASASGELVDYKVGETVKHKVFGVGMITKITPMGNDALIEIAFEKVGTKKLMSRMAKLERV
ncbi:MAG: ATP-dependent DNA helicase PcrA [Ruminococcaceae bacterium]|nr:ATP-dependent DNA helicase PcrA [Oscillospiraceae bacterium]